MQRYEGGGELQSGLDREYLLTENADDADFVNTGENAPHNDSSFQLDRSDDQDSGGTTWYMSSFITMNSALGAGILNFPFAFDMAGGVFWATLVHLILVLLAAVSLYTLGWCSDLKKSNSYQETVYALCGKWGIRSCALIISIYCYFTCVTFLVIVGDQSDTILHDRYSFEFCKYWYMDRRFIIPLTTFLFITPLCFAKNIDFLKYPSALATIGVLYLTVLSVLIYWRTDVSDVRVKHGPNTWSDVLAVVPTVMFGYQMHVSIVPVYSRVRPRNLKNYTRLFCTALTVCFCVYTIVGCFGYWTFGTAIRPDLFSSYSSQNPYVLAGFLLFAIKTLLTYPILIFCGRLALASLYEDVTGSSLEDPSHSTEVKFRCLIGTIWLISSLAVALFVPNIGLIIDILGCLATCFVLLFPGICLIRGSTLLASNRQCKVVLFTGWMFVILGSFVFGMTLTQSIEMNVKSAGSTHGHHLCPNR